MASERERQRRAAEELVLKTRLEIEFSRDMKRIFRHMGKEFTALYATKGQILNVADYNDEITALLRKQYRRISDKFESNLRQEIEKSNKYVFLETKARTEKIKNQINEYIRKRSTEQAAIITDTNAKDLNESINGFINTSIENGNGIPEKDAIALNAGKDFIDKGIGRSDMIAATETQNMAETTKFIEADNIASAVLFSRSGGVEPPTPVKQWNALVDDKTRTNHLIANGQIKKIDEPFLVGGEKLMVPGDTSLGATPGNFINCRCSVSYYYPE